MWEGRKEGKDGWKCQKKTGTDLKKLSMTKAETVSATKHIIMLVLDYNTKNQINIHKCIVIND